MHLMNSWIKILFVDIIYINHGGFTIQCVRSPKERQESLPMVRRPIYSITNSKSKKSSSQPTTSWWSLASSWISNLLVRLLYPWLDTHLPHPNFKEVKESLQTTSFSAYVLGFPKGPGKCAGSRPYSRLQWQCGGPGGVAGLLGWWVPMNWRSSEHGHPYLSTSVQTVERGTPSSRGTQQWPYTFLGFQVTSWTSHRTQQWPYTFPGFLVTS